MSTNDREDTRQSEAHPEREGDPPDEQISGGAEREQRARDRRSRTEVLSDQPPEDQGGQRDSGDTCPAQAKQLRHGWENEAVVGQVVAAVPVVVPQREA